MDALILILIGLVIYLCSVTPKAKEDKDPAPLVWMAFLSVLGYAELRFVVTFVIRVVTLF